MPNWVDQVVWWHVYPLGFTGAEGEALPADAAPVHRLDRLRGWLDHLRDLGADGLLLGPVFASETHGYDTVDHFRVDARLGDDDDLRALVAAAHEAGIHVLVDGVFNHVGRGFAPFRDVYVHGRGSRYAGWFVLHGDGTGDDLDYDHFEGHRRLVTLDHASPDVEDHVVAVMRHWLEEGIDGWRLDAAYAVPPEFWGRVTDRVRSTHPDAWFVGEVIHAPYTPLVTDGGLDAVTQYELWKATWSALNDHNLHELAWTLGRHDDLLGTCRPMTFLGNHDVTRIATRLDDPRHLALAVTVLATLPGTPSIYAGDELAMTGTKEDRPGGDDAVRPAFPATPADLPDDADWGTFRHHQRMLGIRRRHPGLATGRVQVLDVGAEHLSYVVEGDDDRLVVLLSVSDTAHRFERAAAALSSPTIVASSGDDDDPWVVAGPGWAIVTGG